MRGPAYVAAVIAAVGIMLVIAREPADQTDQDLPIAAETTSAASLETLTLSVPEMHCQYACFPKVKNTLEQVDAVAEVQLAKQKDDSVLDNRQVIVKYKEGFDVDKAIGLLAEAGYTDSALVQ
ncbi:MAG: heavy-metal-associated domain-containing protein [Planctomycetota bacterium]|nr:heavy-metal-associated domain-containing protein [Planctomycetota bacterium]